MGEMIEWDDQGMIQDSLIWKDDELKSTSVWKLRQYIWKYPKTGRVEGFKSFPPHNFQDLFSSPVLQDY